MRLLVAVLLALTVAAPVSAAPKAQASCSVTPAPVLADASMTITASASIGFDFYLTEPTGRTWTWPQGPAGTVTYTTPVPSVDGVPVTGAWTVTIRDTHYPHPKVIGGCSFVVVP